jgi:hypothetical protein
MDYLLLKSISLGVSMLPVDYLLGLRQRNVNCNGGLDSFSMLSQFSPMIDFCCR